MGWTDSGFKVKDWTGLKVTLMWRRGLKWKWLSYEGVAGINLIYYLIQCRNFRNPVTKFAEIHTTRGLFFASLSDH